MTKKWSIRVFKFFLTGKNVSFCLRQSVYAVCSTIKQHNRHHLLFLRMMTPAVDSQGPKWTCLGDLILLGYRFWQWRGVPKQKKNLFPVLVTSAKQNGSVLFATILLLLYSSQLRTHTVQDSINSCTITCSANTAHQVDHLL